MNVSRPDPLRRRASPWAGLWGIGSGFAFAAAWLATAAHAATSLSVGSVQAAPGSVARVAISITADVPVSALQFDLAYDAATLQAGTVLGDSALGQHTLATSLPAAGVVRVVVYSRTSANLANGSLVVIPFMVAAPARTGTSPLTLTKAIAADPKGNAVSLALSPGNISIGSGAGLRFLSVARSSPNVVDLTLSVEAGHSYLVQRSVDLKAWSNLATNASPVPPVWHLTDPVTSADKQRFYRAQLR